MSTSTLQPRQPWARLCGLLAGCVATLAGVAQQVDPDVILYRSTVACVAVACVVWVFREVLPPPPQPDDD